MNVTLSPEQIQLILNSLQISVDIANDCVNEDMFPDKESDGFTIAEMHEVREKTNVRIDELVALARLETYLTTLLK